MLVFWCFVIWKKIELRSVFLRHPSFWFDANKYLDKGTNNVMPHVCGFVYLKNPYPVMTGYGFFKYTKPHTCGITLFVPLSEYLSTSHERSTGQRPWMTLRFGQHQTKRLMVIAYVTAWLGLITAVLRNTSLFTTLAGAVRCCIEGG